MKHLSEIGQDIKRKNGQENVFLAYYKVRQCDTF